VSAADAKKWWFIGELRKAFAYMENWPITVLVAGQQRADTSGHRGRFRPATGAPR
jgi:hypothetical protein